MANEITVNARLQCTNGNMSFDRNISSKQFDQAAIGGPTPGYLTIGTSEETEAFAELSSDGWCIIQNLDPTNYIQVGFSTGVYGMRVKAGAFALLPLEPGVTLYLIANTAACKVIIEALEA